MYVKLKRHNSYPLLTEAMAITPGVAWPAFRHGGGGGGGSTPKCTDRKKKIHHVHSFMYAQQRKQAPHKYTMYNSQVSKILVFNNLHL